MGRYNALFPLVCLSLSGLAISTGLEACFSAAQTTVEAELTVGSAHLSPQAAHRLVQANRTNPDFVILDVRTPAEFSEHHLARAINIDFYADGFYQDIAALDRQKTYLIYCRRGIRSDRTLAMMQEMGFPQVYNLLGGMSRWQREGFGPATP